MVQDENTERNSETSQLRSHRCIATHTKKGNAVKIETGRTAIALKLRVFSKIVMRCANSLQNCRSLWLKDKMMVIALKILRKRVFTVGGRGSNSNNGKAKNFLHPCCEVTSWNKIVVLIYSVVFHAKYEPRLICLWLLRRKKT